MGMHAGFFKQSSKEPGETGEQERKWKEEKCEDSPPDSLHPKVDSFANGFVYIPPRPLFRSHISKRSVSCASHIVDAYMMIPIIKMLDRAWCPSVPGVAALDCSAYMERPAKVARLRRLMG